jgi:hypothetical protein
MDGMVYDQLGQLLSIPVDGLLLKEGVDFQTFDLVDNGGVCVSWRMASVSTVHGCPT